MNDTAFTDFTASLISVYPIFRAAIFKAFDSHAKKLTRTQQIILLTMLKKETFSMSGLARSISTSNEQATRAITQLVENGMVLREKNKINRRVINISLTDEARAYLDDIMLLTKEIIAGELYNLPAEAANDLKQDMAEIAAYFKDVNF